MRQQWAELAYFHWAYEPEVVQRLLPPDITVDTFDGRACGADPLRDAPGASGSHAPIPWLGTSPRSTSAPT
ncbi:MAG: DUF2071 domain-containing protein [Candidatus Microthrix sp.]|uniref:DUF2071 domain-containing protein n=1 Tax=Candidatus Neomicrothrix subdominans TaxID=2954438 RepID=A0A936NG99_9ACTN|nr:DUF2071 domain-containing protein [Candidatus Microthrix subdominans]